MRRRATERPVVLAADDLELDPVTHRVHRNNHEITLSPKEFALLELFLRATPTTSSPGRSILEHVWDFAFDGTLERGRRVRPLPAREDRPAVRPGLDRDDPRGRLPAARRHEVRPANPAGPPGRHLRGADRRAVGTRRVVRAHPLPQRRQRPARRQPRDPTPRRHHRGPAGPPAGHRPEPADPAQRRGVRPDPRRAGPHPRRLASRPPHPPAPRPERPRVGRSPPHRRAARATPRGHGPPLGGPGAGRLPAPHRGRRHLGRPARSRRASARTSGRDHPRHPRPARHHRGLARPRRGAAAGAGHGRRSRRLLGAPPRRAALGPRLGRARRAGPRPQRAHRPDRRIDRPRAGVPRRRQPRAAHPHRHRPRRARARRDAGHRRPGGRRRGPLRARRGRVPRAAGRQPAGPGPQPRLGPSRRPSGRPAPGRDRGPSTR